MVKKNVDIVVYGAEQLCPSCVNLPSSRETFEWLEAAVSRKFPNQEFQISYVDIYNPPEDEERKDFAKRVVDEDMFYPVVLIEDEVVGEGNPRLKTIFATMEKYGYKEEASS
ncbi:YuzD family protein [Robertmurraya sp. DFI.2.37]|jgi:disulfide oxidoreductase YuzD|uniref:YuzD family protein n=1 Tax=Robertmurraya sp. DFI.2.37 TaxID=3031819 RepID=UPI0023DBB5B8|nr:YuzD family protein [Robertmurraya sp. DFI.2.37]MDF1510181.1 YuzD family protein [Robertmurraya sp. DFI.2.37]